MHKNLKFIILLRLEKLNKGYILSKHQSPDIFTASFKKYPKVCSRYLLPK